MVQFLPRWNVDLSPVWRYLQDEVVIIAILFRAPFYIAAAVGAASASFAWVLVLTQFVVNILAKYRSNFKFAEQKESDGLAASKPTEMPKKSGRRGSVNTMAGHVHKTRKASYVRVPGMADPKGAVGDSMTDASLVASLRVTVVSAQDLVVKARGSKDPNPYCKLFLIAGGDKPGPMYQTAKCQKTKMPQWSEDKEQKVFEKINVADSVLHVQLWDNHLMWKDQLVGEVAVPVSKIQHGHNECQYELRQSADSQSPTISLGVVTIRTHLLMQDGDLAQILAETKKAEDRLRAQIENDGKEESVFQKDPPPEEGAQAAASADADEGAAQEGGAADAGAAAGAESDGAGGSAQKAGGALSQSRLLAGGLQRMALQVTDLYLHAIVGLGLAFVLGQRRVDVFVLALLVEVLLVLERRLPSLHLAIRDDDLHAAHALHPPLHASASLPDASSDPSSPNRASGGAKDKGDGYQPFLAELFSKVRCDAARGLMDVDAEWLTGALAMAWELYTPWADRFIGQLIRDPLAPFGLDLTYFTVGTLPLVCKSVKGFPHKRPGSYFDLELQVEWAADLYIQVGWNGIPLIVVEGLYLSAGIKACMKMLEMTPDEAPNFFPNLDGMRLCLQRRPELDVQVKLFGILDIFSFMLLSYLKEIALDYVFETYKNLFYYMTEAARAEVLKEIDHFRAGDTLPIERFAYPPGPWTPNAFKGRRFRLVVNCVLGWDLAVKDKTFCVLRFGRGKACLPPGKHGDMVSKHTRAHTEHHEAGYTLWQEQFCWLTREDTDLLEVEIFDHNALREHASFGKWKEEFGFLRRSMNLVPDAEPTFKPIDLAGKGKVHLMVQLQTLWDDPPPALKPKPDAATSKAKASEGGGEVLSKSAWRSQTGLLVLNLIKADSLPPKDLAGSVRRAVCVKFFLVNQALLRNRAHMQDEWFVSESQSAYNTLSPSWGANVTENVFHMEVSKPVSTTLLVAQVWDGKDFIGAEAIRLGDLVGEVGSRTFLSKATDIKKQLFSNDDEPLSADRFSTLHMELEFTPDPLEATPGVQAPHAADPEHPIAVKGPGLPYMRVEIMRAFNLTKMDFIGKSDPFAEVEVYDEPETGDWFADEMAKMRSVTRKRTATMRNTLNPEWTNCVYHFFLSKEHNQRVSVTVKDEDKLGPSSTIGQWTESVRKLYVMRDNTLQPLTTALGEPAGMLELSIKFLGDWSHLAAPSVQSGSIQSYKTP